MFLGKLALILVELFCFCSLKGCTLHFRQESLLQAILEHLFEMWFFAFDESPSDLSFDMSSKEKGWKNKQHGRLLVAAFDSRCHLVAAYGSNTVLACGFRIQGKKHEFMRSTFLVFYTHTPSHNK